MFHVFPGGAHGSGLTLPTVLQPYLDHAQLAAVAARHHLPLLRYLRVQLLFQHVIHLSLLQVGDKHTIILI
jgi:hypothetical protein